MKLEITSEGVRLYMVCEVCVKMTLEETKGGGGGGGGGPFISLCGRGGRKRKRGKRCKRKKKVN
ncbi:hypothetical protein Hanom_Chr04g00303301 [Helianthus anomalus]